MTTDEAKEFVRRARELRDDLDRAMHAGSSETWWEKQVRSCSAEFVETVEQLHDIEEQEPKFKPKNV